MDNQNPWVYGAIPHINVYDMNMLIFYISQFPMLSPLPTKFLS